MNDHDVISAFLDNEPFDPQELETALSDPSGRRLLIELVALRALVQADDGLDATSARPWWTARAVRFTAVAAALVLVLVGGYRVGVHSATTAVNPPTPTSFVDAGTTWHDMPNGRVQ